MPTWWKLSVIWLLEFSVVFFESLPFRVSFYNLALTKICGFYARKIWPKYQNGTCIFSKHISFSISLSLSFLSLSLYLFRLIVKMALLNLHKASGKIPHRKHSCCNRREAVKGLWNRLVQGKLFAHLFQLNMCKFATERQTNRAEQQGISHRPGNCCTNCINSIKIYK